MSAIEFLSSGGMASIGGDLPEEERKTCNDLVKKFGEEVRNFGRQLQIPAVNLSLFRTPFLFIAKDVLNYHFAFVDKPGDNVINYRDLSSHGSIPLQVLLHQIRIEIGEVIWAFSVPIGLAKTIDSKNIQELAQHYIETTLQALRKDRQTVTNEALSFPEIAKYIDAFRKDHPTGTKTAFIMMQFSKTDLHEKIVEIIRATLKQSNIIGLRADDKEYADELFANVRTYMHCTDFGIAVFERILEDDFNPNVSLEVGYMMGLGKQVCFLKDRTLKQLHTDLVGKLYKEFNPQDIEKTLPTELEKWLKDKGFI